MTVTQDERAQRADQAAAGPILRAKVAGMDCGSCALTIEDGLRQLAGVRRVSVDFTTETLELEGTASRAQVEHRLRQLGYGLAGAEHSDEAAAASGAARGSGGFLKFLWTQSQQRLALAAAMTALLASGMAVIAPTLASQANLKWVLVATVVIVGAPIFIKGLRALIFSRRVTIDLLMTVAALGAVLIGEAGEAATVVLLFTFGEGLERFSAARARDSLRSLLALQPQTATVLRKQAGGAGHENSREHEHAPDHQHGSDDEHGHEPAHDCCADGSPAHMAVVRAESLAPGDLILVRPGERVAADGVIRSGQSSINQAAVTGESIPVPKAAGDAVMAGTVNAEGALEIEVTRKSSDSTVARIAQLVEQAQAQRSPAERFIDRFARWYTPAVVALAIAVVAIPVLVFGQPLLDPSDGVKGWLYRGLALLIVACPCALVISIPVTVVSSLTRLARLGVLVKGGEKLDQLAEIRAIAFDKTGTLTQGRPSVTAVQARGCAHEVHTEPACVSCDDVIALAATVERGSEHPIAHAIMESAAARGLVHRYPPARKITAVAGRGIIGELRGSTIAVGTDALLSEHGASVKATEFASLRESSRTMMMVARGSDIVGAIGVEDPIRPESRRALEELQRFRPRVRTVMLTGDNERVARGVAESVGVVDDVRSGLLPADKLAAIHQLQKEHGSVAMVGDGINDAPALARADVGIAMGATGTAQAMETADIVLMTDDLQRVPTALRIARRNRAVVKQNIALSLGLKLAFLALAIPGLATLWLAVGADVGATVLVTLNGMRMLRAK
jgi:Cd2+/Zn2+-exporting ATPase